MVVLNMIMIKITMEETVWGQMSEPRNVYSFYS